MNPIVLAYKRLYEGFNYRLRTLALERWASHCRPTSIALALTDRCNARCLHCDIWRNRGPEDTPTAQQWRTVLTELRRWLGRVQVTFTGGEALMLPFAIDLIRHAVDIGLVVEILTNGYWNNQQKIENLAMTNPWRITVSLDGIGTTHSLIRGRPDFFERTQKSLQTLERIRHERRLGFKIRLKSVVMQHNLDEVHEIARYAGARSGFEVFYQPIEQNYNTREDPRWYEHSDNWPKNLAHAVAVVRNLISLKREGLPIANSFPQLEAMEPYFLHPELLRLTTQNHSAHESRNLCSALTTLEVHADGAVFTCARMAAVGNIKEQPVREIWEQREQWWRVGCCQQEHSANCHNLSGVT
jgi:MoaA/NifB/PqqE/SkfB family radical SAM enzyme